MDLMPVPIVEQPMPHPDRILPSLSIHAANIVGRDPRLRHMSTKAHAGGNMQALVDRIGRKNAVRRN